MTNDFKVSAPSLLGATFSVKTTADDEPIIAKVDERGHWFFTVPSDMDARLLSAVQDICEAQFAPSTLAHIRADRFFEDALSEAKDIPSPSDEFEKSRQLVATDVTATILRDVDESDLHLFKDFFSESKHTFESMSRAMQKLIFYKQFKNKEI
jgi:hypothetical protein